MIFQAFRHRASATFIWLYSAFFAVPTTNAMPQDGQSCDYRSQLLATKTSIRLPVTTSFSPLDAGRLIDGICSPWPWTLNVNGQSKWFKIKDAALTYRFQKLKAGEKNSVDRCFQINFGRQRHAFASKEQMLDPSKKTEFVTVLLSKPYQEFGSWRLAFDAFHSRTTKNITAYLQKYHIAFAAISNPAAFQNTQIPQTSLMHEISSTKIASLSTIAKAQQNTSRSTILSGGAQNDV